MSNEDKIDLTDDEKRERASIISKMRHPKGTAMINVQTADARREWIEQHKIAYILHAADGSVAAQFDISATLRDAMDVADAERYTKIKAWLKGK